MCVLLLAAAMEHHVQSKPLPERRCADSTLLQHRIMHEQASCTPFPLPPITLARTALHLHPKSHNLEHKKHHKAPQNHHSNRYPTPTSHEPDWPQKPFMPCSCIPNKTNSTRITRPS